MDRFGEYVGALFAPEDAVLLALRDDADRAGLPPISISPDTGRLLQVLIRATGARRILEVGTLGGYSAIWMARALPADGRLVTIEHDAGHAAFAREHIAAAGLSHVVDVQEGQALQLLPAFDGEEFDLVFLDADKEPLPTYLEWALRLVRPGGAIVADNALWGGRVLDERERDDATLGVREFNRRLATDPRLTSIIVPTHDGVAIGIVGQRPAASD
ncbi:MAG: O-methyltransferase [Gemmatimonadaceae bacterium]|nr:O-methyltransferase [Gemmatimonadaceae bacterium]